MIVSISGSELLSQVALLSLFYGANLTQTSFNIVVKFLNLRGSNIPQKFDHIVNKFFNKKYNDCVHPFKEFTKIFYCKECDKTIDMLDFSKQRHCLRCKTRLTMHYCFNIESQIRNIINRKIINFEQASGLNSDSAIISYVVDCTWYREFLKTSQGQSVLNGKGFTLSLNTDGANPSNKSTISLWPVFITVNEIPIEERYCIENVVVAGKNEFIFVESIA